jgi:hypothetical protein
MVLENVDLVLRELRRIHREAEMEEAETPIPLRRWHDDDVG